MNAVWCLESKSKLAIKIVVSLVMLVAPVLFSYLYARDRLIEHPFELYLEGIGQVLTFTPVIVALLAVPTLDQLLLNNAFIVIRVRKSAFRVLKDTWLTSCVYVTVAVLIPVAFFGVAATLIWGAHRMYPTPTGRQWGRCSGSLLQQLVHNNWSLFVCVFSIWVFIQAIIYMTISFMLRLLYSQRWISYIVPQIGMMIVTVLVAIAGHPEWAPQTALVPFMISAQPEYNFMIPIVGALIVIVFCGIELYRLSPTIPAAK